jgi:hypothetical protein
MPRPYAAPRAAPTATVSGRRYCHRVEIKENRVLDGVLIAESLRVGTEPAGVPLRVTKIARVEVEGAAAGQPQRWTLLDFTGEEADAEPLAERPAACLDPAGGSYVNYTPAAEAFVVFPGAVFPGEVFPGEVFRCPRGRDRRGRAEGRRRAQDHARSTGIPEAQPDWRDRPAGHRVTAVDPGPRPP